MFADHWAESCEPLAWLVAGMGDAAWAGSLAVRTLGEPYTQLRPGAVSGLVG